MSRKAQLPPKCAGNVCPVQSLMSEKEKEKLKCLTLSTSARPRRLEQGTDH